MDLYAFELEPPLSEDQLNGATVAFGPLAEVFDIKKALVEGDGTIVTDDPQLIATLRGFPILQAADLPQGATPVALPPGAATQDTVQAPLYVPQEPLNLGPTYVQPDVSAVPENVEAVHADEPSTEEEAGEVPVSQQTDSTDDPPSRRFGGGLRSE